MLLKRVDEGGLLSSFDGWDDLGGVAKGEGGKERGSKVLLANFFGGKRARKTRPVKKAFLT